jgi:hypothetical protein
MRISVILCPFASIQRVAQKDPEARRLSAPFDDAQGNRHMGLFQQSAMRLANSAGEAMAKERGIMKALMAMSPQMAAE